MSERIKSALLSGTSTAVQGPQVLSVSFKAQSPAVARATLTALLSTFAAQRTALVAQSEGTLQILDAPSTPAGPTSGASKSLATILIGLLAGVAVTIAAVAILVLLKDRKRRATAPDGAGPDRIRNAAGGIVVPVAAATALATSASLHGGGRSNGTPSGASEHAGDGGSADASQDEIILAAEQNGSSAAEVAPRRTASRAPADEDSAAAAGADVSISGIVRDVRVVRNGEARRVVWVVATSPGIPAIARRSRVTLSDAPDGAGIVRRVETRPEGVDLYVEFTNAATDGASDDVPAASDRSWVGHDVTLTTDPAAPRVRVARKSGA
jgi:hypothetical protein